MLKLIWEYFEQLNQFGNKKGEEYFQIVSKATKQKFWNMISFYLKKMLYNWL